MPTLNEFAQRWGIAHQRVQQLRDAGMPLDSFEAAEAWRAARKGGVAQMGTQAVKRAVEAGLEGGASEGVTDFAALLDMEDFISQLQFQRNIVKVNRAEYLKALQAKSPSASKHYTSLNKAITQLFQIRDKALAHGLATKQLINANTAQEGLRRAFALMVSKYEAAEVPMAKEANPGDSARALAAIRSGRLKIQREIYELAQASAVSLFGKDGSLPPFDDIAKAVSEADKALEGQGVSEDTPEPLEPPSEPAEGQGEGV
jgi:hypothetical protein